MKGAVIYVGGFELPDKNAAAHRVIGNSKILRDEGYDVILVGVDKSRSDESGALRSKEDYFGFECWSLPYPKAVTQWIKYLCGLSGLLNFIRKYPNKIHSVVFYNYPSFAQLIVLMIFGRKIPNTISDITEWYDSSGGGSLFRVVKKIDTLLRIYCVANLSSGIITTSSYMTEFYSRKNKKIVELPTLYDTTVLSPPSVFDDKGFVRFIYVGVPFDVEKVNSERTNLKERLDRSIEIFYGLYKDDLKFEFFVVGINKEDYLTVFDEHRDMLNEMDGVVNFVGRVPHSKALHMIASSDFSVFFRDVNRVTLAGFPSKFAESISLGTPVITNHMRSLESYSSAFIFKVGKGQELEVFRDLLFRSAADIDAMKLSAFNSKMFDYRCYKTLLKLFS